MEVFERIHFLNDFIAALIRFVALSVALVVGAVFFVVFFFFALIFGLYWAVSRIWARLTGKPVKPWVFQFNPKAGFTKAYSNVYRGTASKYSSRSGASGASSGRFINNDDVTDVTPK